MGHHNSEVHEDNSGKNYWEKELEKKTLKEPPLKSKFQWIKPLTVYHALVFRGLNLLLLI
jgi:hypothetical protein